MTSQKSRTHPTRWGPAVALGVGFALSILYFSAVSAAPLASKGPIPEAAVLANGDLDARLVPDFVSVYGRDGESIAGYVPKAYILHSNEPTVTKERPSPPIIPVYGEDLETLVGHMFPGRGFVPAGTDPASIPLRQVEVSGG